MLSDLVRAVPLPTLTTIMVTNFTKQYLGSFPFFFTFAIILYKQKKNLYNLEYSAARKYFPAH